MTRINFFTFWALSLLILIPKILAARSLLTQQNIVVEWSYRSDTEYANPFREVVLHAVIESDRGREIRLPAFWAGGNEWRFRFSSPVTGVFKFRTICNDPKNSSLHDQTGEIAVHEYHGFNPLFKHGTLKVSDDKKHLTHLDGKPFLWLADSWWHGMTQRFQWPADFKALTSDRKHKGFSVIQFAVGFPCDIEPFDPRGQNEAGDPWNPEFNSINPAYFELVDQRINHLIFQGMLPNIVGSWGYYIKWSGVDNMKKHWDYLIARYGAYPVTWTLCGEVTLAYYDDLEDNWDFYKKQFREQWSEVARHIQTNDPFDRLLTVHPGPGAMDGLPPINDMSAIDFVMVQSGHGGYHNLPRATEMIRQNLMEYPDKPVLHGEVCFEGMHGGGSGERVQRFLFWSNMLMGTCGFSYGAEGIWQFNTDEELFGISPGGNNWGNVPWEIAFKYNGSRHVGVGKKILEQFHWWNLEPDQGLIESAEEGVFGPYSARLDGEMRMVYLYNFPARWRKTFLTRLEPSKKYTLDYFDPLTGDKYAQGQFTPDASGKLLVPPVPIMQDWVLLLRPAN